MLARAAPSMRNSMDARRSAPRREVPWLRAIGMVDAGRARPGRRLHRPAAGLHGERAARSWRGTLVFAGRLASALPHAPDWLERGAAGAARGARRLDRSRCRAAARAAVVRDALRRRPIAAVAAAARWTLRSSARSTSPARRDRRRWPVASDQRARRSCSWTIPWFLFMRADAPPARGARDHRGPGARSCEASRAAEAEAAARRRARAPRARDARRARPLAVGARAAARERRGCWPPTAARIPRSARAIERAHGLAAGGPGGGAAGDRRAARRRPARAASGCPRWWRRSAAAGPARRVRASRASSRPTRGWRSTAPRRRRSPTSAATPPPTRVELRLRLPRRRHAARRSPTTATAPPPPEVNGAGYGLTGHARARRAARRAPERGADGRRLPRRAVAARVTVVRVLLADDQRLVRECAGHAARAARRHRARRHGRRRRRGGRPGRRAPAGRRADGPAHAALRRHRGDATADRRALPPRA